MTRRHAWAVGEVQTALVDLEPLVTENTNNYGPPFTHQVAPGRSTFPWPSIATDAHHPGFRLPVLDASLGAIHAEHVAVVVEMLIRLKHLDMIERLLNEFYNHSPAALVPGPLLLPAFSALRTHVIDISSRSAPGRVGSDDTTLQIAESVVQSTSTNIDIELTSTPSRLCASYTGQNLRLEVVGLIFALAGRSCLLGPSRDDRRDEFVHTMFRCSTCCMQIAREIAQQINDLMVWLSYENLLLTMSIQGDASELHDDKFGARPNVWRRLGDLTTDVYALGIHRESTHAGKMPFFISECRRRTFAAAYQVDKLICTFFDRPPRILRRYSDCKMPLDLADDEILADTNEVDRVGLILDPEGWSATPRYASSTWARLRYVLSVFREEILEVPFRPQIVAVIIQLGKSRDKAVLPRLDFPYVVVNYGLPSAATLVAALQTSTRNRTRQLPQNLSRSALIRSLMVFTSYLESIGDVGEAIHSTCMQATQAISRTLDNMLDEPPSMSSTTPGMTVPASMPCDDLDTPFSPSQFLQPSLDTTGFPNFDLLNSNALDDFDLSGWLNNVTWTGNYVG
ncbi:uncharacterized protein N7498_007682 [Penicillium cinerascens]|uniref:Xylanolytic transcriptional activator regulatory domain-containing protein n=1 Tax=Penicillium cinerascens TaxID=70096 RepID=A0A9W9MDL0_9EURO|nr:uncharacterized protein N7498_007682 [Penicillium cinerascens]KAJ5198565.1 hypothetical protein N7498_007682 [Penicillium cinerascens]